jgi:DNA-binding MarR family transcriptional regulator
MNSEIYSIFIKLVRTGKRVSTAFDRRLKGQEITLTQCEVLLALAESGPIRQTDLADQILVNKATLIPMIERLERQGWIKKQSNADDHRSYFLALTDAGKKCSDQVKGAMKKIARDLSYEMGARNTDALSEILDKIAKTIEGDEK